MRQELNSQNAPAEHKLTNVIKEMASTEKSYLGGLQNLVNSKALLKLADKAKTPADKQLLLDAHKRTALTPRSWNKN